eukprot:TRINITY_DN6685_c0_g2_i7.p1 TRINITY_DN6685_c0_g2~~TRINITY_DN6685_c0_g2_i7.p1  ORF type:complete len:186 (+),score=24.38 TRINITY_DN6685_c0_g2_i7:294-851(+)
MEPLKWWEPRTLSNEELTTNGQKLLSKVAGDIPPPYPNGWYFVMLSHEIAKGEVKTVRMLGQDVVVYRGQSGRVTVIDAFCPHLGAHLGGGTVVDDNIRCSFHAWEFNCTGTCVKIPYGREGEMIPKNSGVRAWKSIELNNMILIHFDADGREPSYIPVELPDINSGEFVYHGRSDHVIRCHIQV